MKAGDDDVFVDDGVTYSLTNKQRTDLHKSLTYLGTRNRLDCLGAYRPKAQEIISGGDAHQRAIATFLLRAALTYRDLKIVLTFLNEILSRTKSGMS